jgi:FkbM family methyltransferase
VYDRENRISVSVASTTCQEYDPLANPGRLPTIENLRAIGNAQRDRKVSIRPPREFNVPLFRADTCWDRRELEGYEKPLVDSFCRKLEPLFDIVLFDCGADIGTFSALVCSQTSKVARVVAFEPNPDVAKFVKRNSSQLGVPAEAITKAIGCFSGTGRLEFPNYDDSDHSRFLVPGDGPLDVVTIDSFGVRRGDVGIKIEVEGGELEVLKGSAETISSARSCVISWEAHAQVARRTMRDPIECLRFLQSLRPFSFVIAETGESPSGSLPIIKVGQRAVVNIVGWTHQTNVESEQRSR